MTRAVLECPLGLVPFGGGVSVPVFGPESVNSSFPTPTGWAASVSNPGTASTFEVIFTCGERPRHYAVARSASVTVSPGQQRSAVALCPTGSDPLGGGGFSDSGLASVTMARTFPVPGQWVVAQSNASAADTHVTAFAVCGTLRGYRLLSNPISMLFSGLTIGGAACPSAKVPLGGGAFTNSTSLAVTAYSSFPSAGGWSVDLRNAIPGGGAVLWQPLVVCAGRRA